MKEKEQSDEIIIKAIEEWIKTNKGNVSFYASFTVFDDDCNVKEDRMLCYGVKDCIKIELDEFTKLVNKEKKDFINW